MRPERTQLLLELQEINGRLENVNATLKRAAESKTYFLARKAAVVRDLHALEK